MAKLVLCSQSPRRQELLRQMGVSDFDVRVPQVEETVPQGLSPRETVERISREKAAGAQELCGPGEVFLTADTMVFLDGERLGKPRDEADALRMLTALQGREHSVCTGVTVGQDNTLLTRSEETFVRFLPATEERLRRYIASPWTRPEPTASRAWGPSWWKASGGTTPTWLGCPSRSSRRCCGSLAFLFCEGR